MVTRRSLLGAAAGTGVLALAPSLPANAAGKGPARWTRGVSANGWKIDPAAITTYRVEGSNATVALRQGRAAAVLLHVARRWHYEIAPLDTGEGGGITGHTTRRAVLAEFESNYLSGTAIALHPTAYPVAGSERLWPHHEAIVRDILADCEGTVVWGGDLTPIKTSHFEIVTRPGDKVLASVAARFDISGQTKFRMQTAGVVADPATPARREKARRLPRPR
ncbi:hypothetical protein [Micromonospora sp. U21]|uniref:hypothetical protein n=1 Tax=Micromonospora sp. U21 TaxID=2824899 RepID=UPI001B37B527|nr:hypothetical protein [Micromonospora sp. U21]MBQ0904332.1 hypothetical protein [Micromonospora sp. U21]